MIYVGIDAASEKHDFFMFHNSINDCYRKSSTTISNSLEGFLSLDKAIRDFCLSYNDFDVKIGIESTGIYHQNLLSFLVGKQFTVYLLNPILTARFAKAQSIHHAKTDNIDSKMIADYVYCNSSKLFCFSKNNCNLMALKTLNRERFKVSEQRKKVKIHIYNILVRYFPEFLKLFPSYCTESALSVLEKYPDKLSISRAHESSLNNLINGKCHAKAKDLINAAKLSVGLNDPVLKTCLIADIQQYRMYSKILNTYDIEIHNYINNLNPCIRSIPGIGDLSASFIIAEIGDINRFHSADALVSYAGLDVYVYESGNFKATHSFATKKGSHYLRYALYNAARILVLYDPVFKDYMSKKRDEGKHFFVALAHVQKKLLRTIYSMLKSGSTFNTTI